MLLLKFQNGFSTLFGIGAIERYCLHLVSPILCQNLSLRLYERDSFFNMV